MKTLLGVMVCVMCAGTLPAPDSPVLARAAATLQSTASDSTEDLLSARTVTVIGKTGKRMMDRAWANPDGYRAKEKVEAVLKEWGKYEIVEGSDHADLVLIVFETQKNLNLFKLANLVAELKVYRGGQDLTEETPTLWSGDAAEAFKKLPATKVAEKFRDHVIKLSRLRPETLVD
jgi:hypothetical protein